MKEKNKSILFIAYNDEKWMGGVYYIKNIVYQFLEYAKSVDNEKYMVYLYLSHDLDDIFLFCKEYENVTFLYKRESFISKGESFIRRNIRELEWILRIYGKRIDYIYPSFSEKSIYRNRIISWIPDFQHVYLPEFFSENEKKFRNQYFGTIAVNHSKLVLSSQNAYDTYKQLYPDYVKNVGVVHFVSAVFPDELNENIDAIMEKYKLIDKNYFIVSNQFYRHKNHLLLFEAVKKLIDSGTTNIQIVCTGMTEDVKDPSYFSEVQEYIKKNALENNIHILGLIPRREQLTLMKEAIAVVQPSLFEGWGTSAEDAKALGKILILSDIDVHKEQATSDSIFFDKNSSSELACALQELWNRYYGENKIFEYGIKNAEEYGKQFADILE